MHVVIYTIYVEYITEINLKYSNNAACTEAGVLLHMSHAHEDHRTRPCKVPKTTKFIGARYENFKPNHKRLVTFERANEIKIQKLCCTNDGQLFKRQCRFLSVTPPGDRNRHYALTNFA